MARAPVLSAIKYVGVGLWGKVVYRNSSTRIKHCTRQGEVRKMVLQPHASIPVGYVVGVHRERGDRRLLVRVSRELCADRAHVVVVWRRVVPVSTRWCLGPRTYIAYMTRY